MTRYLIMETSTPQSAAAMMKNPQDRTEFIRSIIESVGGKLEHFYVAYSENTAYLLADIPDHESLGAILWAFQAGGAAISLKATPIMTASEAVEIAKRAGTLGYHPPTA